MPDAYKDSFDRCKTRSDLYAFLELVAGPKTRIYRRREGDRIVEERRERDRAEEAAIACRARECALRLRREDSLLPEVPPAEQSDVAEVLSIKDWAAQAAVRDAEQRGRAREHKAQLTDTEQFIVEALGEEHMTGSLLLKKAGYDYSSHYRQILSNLVKRGILRNDKTGYFCPET